MASRYLCVYPADIINCRSLAVEKKVADRRKMSAQPNFSPRFVRKTQLGANEYRKNFQQIDREIISTVTSREADQVTPLMSKVYLQLINAPAQYWERDGVLRFEAEFREEGKSVKAWAALCELLGVASATASKALTWLHEVGVIGYFAGKNGVGIRIFLNRAASSIGTRPGVGSKKILEFTPASRAERRASRNEPAFNDSFAVRENSDTDINPCAPKIGADKEPVDKISSDPAHTSSSNTRAAIEMKGREAQAEAAAISSSGSIEQIVRRLKCEIEPVLQSAAAQAARREHERTREWLDKCGIPKAARVAQREAYNVLRSHGVINDSAQRARADLEVGRNQYTPVAKSFSPEEIKEMAEVCIAMLDTQGQAIDVTLSEISSEAGGFLLPEDAPRVREMAIAMAEAMNRKKQN
jgi:hypothetical protein